MWFTLARDVPTRAEVIQQVNELQSQANRRDDINRDDVKLLMGRIDTLNSRIDRLVTVLTDKGNDAGHAN